VGRRDVNRGHAKTRETECIRGFGEPDGKTGGNDGVGCVGEVICIYPYVPLKNERGKRTPPHSGEIYPDTIKQFDSEWRIKETPLTAGCLQ